jgi:hypothetical protein
MVVSCQKIFENAESVYHINFKYPYCLLAIVFLKGLKTVKIYLKTSHNFFLVNKDMKKSS